MKVKPENVSTWFKSNKLSLNVDKIKWLLYHPLLKRKLFSQTLPNLLFENIHIKNEHVTKFLAVFIAENLCWKQHIDVVRSKISKSISILYKSRDVLSKQCLKQQYFLFICNYVNYENIAWASTSKSKHDRLYRCQKKCCSCVCVCVCVYSFTVKGSSVCKMSGTYLRVRINDVVL